jgi:hypothetical protein
VYDNLRASTNTPLNVTLYNFFDAEVQRAILNLSTNFNSPITFTNVSAGAVKSTTFTLNLAASQNLTLWIFYEIPGASYVANATIPAELTKTKAVGYYDLRLKSERGTVSDRFSETINVN